MCICSTTSQRCVVVAGVFVPCLASLLMLLTATVLGARVLLVLVDTLVVHIPNALWCGCSCVLAGDWRRQ